MDNLIERPERKPWNLVSSGMVGSTEILHYANEVGKPMGVVFKYGGA